MQLCVLLGPLSIILTVFLSAAARQPCQTGTDCEGTEIVVRSNERGILKTGFTFHLSTD